MAMEGPAWVELLPHRLREDWGQGWIAADPLAKLIDSPSNPIGPHLQTVWFPGLGEDWTWRIEKQQEKYRHNLRKKTAEKD